MSWADAVRQRFIQARPVVDAAEPVLALPSLAASWRTDAPAAVVVFLVALPLCLGIALASGAPLFAGLISGIVGGIVVGTLSGSQLMVSGPAAGLTAIVISAIGTLGSFRAFLAAVVVAGCVQIGLAILRAGVIGYYFPTSVIRGMLTAIGVILILKQIPHLVGYDVDYVGDETFAQANSENTFTAIAHAFERVEPAAVVLSLVAMAMLIAWDRTSLGRMKLLPGPLAVVLVGMVGQWLLPHLHPSLMLGPSHLVQLPVPETLVGFAAMFTWPDWSALARTETWRIAVTLGIVASLETLLSLEATDRMDPFKREAPTDRELAAQGAGNIIAGLIGGLPITGVIVRSAANVGAGAQTKLSAVLHGVLLLIAVMMIPVLLNTIPLASLAAILLYTGYKLAHPRLLRYMWSQGHTQWLPFAVTVIAILLTDLLIGIAIGLAVGFTFILLDQLRYPGFAIVSHAGAVLTRVRLHEQVSFLHKGSLAEMLDGLPRGSRVEIDGSACRHIDHDVLEFLSDFRQTATLKRIDFRIV
ncbi:MAG: SulP family inorganic anion transporter, partial [Acidobacteria bacterium]|nr:SulP family inorganic anion transporter [Acidobacteriota bacterium]